eukprot:1520165-Rhodomonas_salina.1
MEQELHLEQKQEEWWNAEQSWMEKALLEIQGALQSRLASEWRTLLDMGWFPAFVQLCTEADQGSKSECNKLCRRQSITGEDCVAAGLAIRAAVWQQELSEEEEERTRMTARQAARQAAADLRDAAPQAQCGYYKHQRLGTLTTIYSEKQHSTLLWRWLDLLLLGSAVVTYWHPAFSMVELLCLHIQAEALLI